MSFEQIQTFPHPPSFDPTLHSSEIGSDIHGYTLPGIGPGPATEGFAQVPFSRWRYGRHRYPLAAPDFMYGSPYALQNYDIYGAPRVRRTGRTGRTCPVGCRCKTYSTQGGCLDCDCQPDSPLNQTLQGGCPSDCVCTEYSTQNKCLKCDCSIKPKPLHPERSEGGPWWWLVGLAVAIVIVMAMAKP